MTIFHMQIEAFPMIEDFDDVLMTIPCAKR
jgi:hypothetical protein